jgi:hypothetical protein
LQIRGWRRVVGGRNRSTVGWGWGRRFGGRRVEYHGWQLKRTLKTDGGRTGGAGGTNSGLCVVSQAITHSDLEYSRWYDVDSYEAWKDGNPN